MVNEKISLKTKDINEALSDYQVQSLEQVVLEGDIEIEMDLPGGSQLVLAQPLGQEFARPTLQPFHFSRAMRYPVDSGLQTAMSWGSSAGK